LSMTERGSVLMDVRSTRRPSFGTKGAISRITFSVSVIGTEITITSHMETISLGLSLVDLLERITSRPRSSNSLANHEPILPVPPTIPTFGLSSPTAHLLLDRIQGA